MQLKRFAVSFRSKVVGKLILKLLKEKGYPPFTDEDYALNTLSVGYDGAMWCNLCEPTSARYGKYFCAKQLVEFFEYMDKSVPDNILVDMDSYVTTVFPNKVKLGAYSFSFEDFDKLAAAVNKMRDLTK